MEGEDRTWQFEGLYRSELFRLAERMNSATQKRNIRIARKGWGLSTLLKFLFPLQREVLYKRMTKASARLAKDFKTKHGLSGFEMWKLSDDIARKVG